MNKVYVVKRNAHGQSVVCSELTRSHGKIKSIALAVIAACSVMADALAVTTQGQNQTLSPTTSVAIGDGIIATGDSSVAIGDYVKATGNESTAVGTRSTTFGNQSTATGSYAFADGNQSTSNGHASSAMAIDTIAIGVNSGAAGGSMIKETFDRLRDIDKAIKEYFEPEERMFTYIPSTSKPTISAAIENKPYPIPYNNLMSSAGFDWTNPYSQETAISFPDVMAVYGGLKLNYSISSKNLEGDYATTLENFNKADANYVAFKSKILTAYHDFKSSLRNTYSDTEIRDAFKIIARKADGTTIAKYDNLSEQEKTRFDALKNALMYFNTYLAKWQNFQKDSGIDREQELFANDDWVSDDWFSTVHDYSTTEARQELENQYNTLKEYLAQYPSVNVTELKAELTRIANEAGFDGTFESLSDVFGSKAGRAIAIGNNAYVSGDESVGVGYGNKVTGNQANVFGTHNNVTKANNNVMGNDNNITVSEGNVIVGNAITFAQGVTTSDNIALGSNTVISAPVPTASVEIQGVTHNFAGTNPTSVLSIANEGNERQIQNVAAGRVTNTSTDAINGSQLYAVVEALNAIQTINLDDISDAIGTEINVTGGDNVQVNREGNNFTISATGTTLTAGDNITVEGDATNGYTIKATNTQSVVKAGNGVTVDVADNDIGTKDYTVSTKIGDGLSFDENGAIRANGTTLHAGENVEITGDANSGYTISSKTQIINGGKATVVHAGDNVRVTGDVDNGFTVNVDNMRTTVTGGQGAEVASSDNADGSKNYTVNVKVGEGLTYDDKGNLVNDMKLTAGDNVQVSGDAKGGYTISATDTNTQATVSADKGIIITETNNANGTKNYAVSAKLGKGLKMDENGAISATAQPINGGAGVTITTNAQDEAIVNVTGVTTTTDDGKSYTRSDLTKSVGVKGDGKNIRTSTTANGDVQVKLADDVKVNSVTTGNVSISTKGVNAGGKKVTNVAPAEISPTSTDAVNGSQLHATNIQVHNNTQNIAKLGDRVNHLDTKVNKVNKEARAGIAGTVATASLPQVYMAGKSMVSAAAGHYKNENAVAVGYSRASDNGKLVFKLNSSANTRGDFTVGTGIGYQW